jgi:hypothetical protein
MCHRRRIATNIAGLCPRCCKSLAGVGSGATHREIHIR